MIDPDKYPCGHPRTFYNTTVRPKPWGSCCTTCHRLIVKKRRQKLQAEKHITKNKIEKSPKCPGTTKDGKSCRQHTNRSGYCHNHEPKKENT